MVAVLHRFSGWWLSKEMAHAHVFFLWLLFCDKPVYVWLACMCGWHKCGTWIGCGQGVEGETSTEWCH